MPNGGSYLIEIVLQLREQMATGMNAAVGTLEQFGRAAQRMRGSADEMGTSMTAQVPKAETLKRALSDLASQEKALAEQRAASARSLANLPMPKVQADGSMLAIQRQMNDMKIESTAIANTHAEALGREARALDGVASAALAASHGASVARTGAAAAMFTIPRTASLPPRMAEVENRYASAVEADPRAWVQAYLARQPAKSKNVVNADEARELFPEYRENRSFYAPAVHEPSSAIAKLVYAELLANAKPGASVAITAGGAGSGKTTATAGLNQAADIILDTTGSNARTLKRNIQQALDSGANVMLQYVLRDPIESFNSALTRAMPKKPGDAPGRTVPYDLVAGQHSNAPAAFEEMATHFSDAIANGRVQLAAIDNRLGAGKQQLHEGDDAIALVRAFREKVPAEKELANEFRQILDKRHAEGSINEAVFRGTVVDRSGETPRAGAPGVPSGAGSAAQGVAEKSLVASTEATARAQIKAMQSAENAENMIVHLTTEASLAGIAKSGLRQDRRLHEPDEPEQVWGFSSPKAVDADYARGLIADTLYRRERATNPDAAQASESQIAQAIRMVGIPRSAVEGRVTEAGGATGSEVVKIAGSVPAENLMLWDAARNKWVELSSAMGTSAKTTGAAAVETAKQSRAAMLSEIADEKGILAHVTLRSNLASIAREGLKPEDGGAENSKKTYFWDSRENAEGRIPTMEGMLRRYAGTKSDEPLPPTAIVGVRESRVGGSRPDPVWGNIGARVVEQPVTPQDLLLWDSARNKWVELSATMGESAKATGAAAVETTKQISAEVLAARAGLQSRLHEAAGATPEEFAQLHRTAFMSEDIGELNAATAALEKYRGASQMAKTSGDGLAQSQNATVSEAQRVALALREEEMQVRKLAEQWGVTAAQARKALSAQAHSVTGDNEIIMQLTHAIHGGEHRGGGRGAAAGEAALNQALMFGGTPGMVGFGAKQVLDPLVEGSEMAKSAMLGVGLAAASIGVAIEEIKKLAETGAKLGALGRDIESFSQKTGIATSDIQAFQAAGAGVNVTADQMRVGIRFLNKSLSDGDPLLKQLGITTKDTKQALLQLSDVFHQSADDDAKSAVAMKLFGRAGSEMVPFLNLGSKAIMEHADSVRALGAVYSGSALRDMGRLSAISIDTEHRMKAFNITMQQAAMPLIEFGTKAVNAAAEGMTALGLMVKVGMTNMAEGFAAIRALGSETHGMGAHGPLDWVLTALNPLAAMKGLLDDIVDDLQKLRLSQIANEMKGLEDTIAKKHPTGTLGGKAATAAMNDPDVKHLLDLGYESDAIQKAMAEQHKSQRQRDKEAREAASTGTASLQGAIDRAANEKAAQAAADAARKQLQNMSEEVMKLGATASDNSEKVRRFVRAFMFDGEPIHDLVAFQKAMGGTEAAMEALRANKGEIEFGAEVKRTLEQIKADRAQFEKDWHLKLPPLEFDIDAALNEWRNLHGELQAEAKKTPITIEMEWQHMNPKGGPDDQVAPEVPFDPKTVPDDFRVESPDERDKRASAKPKKGTNEDFRRQIKEAADAGRQLRAMFIDIAGTIADGIGDAFMDLVKNTGNAVETINKMLEGVFEMIVKTLVRLAVFAGIGALLGVPLPVVAAAAGPVASTIDTGSTNTAQTFSLPAPATSSGASNGGDAARATGGVQQNINVHVNALDIASGLDSLRSPGGMLRRAFAAEDERAAI